MSDSQQSVTSELNNSIKDNLQISPDTLSDDTFFEASNSNEAPLSEPESVHEEPEWKGVGMEEIRKGLDKYGCEQLATVAASSRHTVLFALPIAGRGSPKPYPSHQRDKWSPGYVRMPHSPQSLYPNNHTNGSQGFRQRWEVIQEALLRSFISSHELEVAILSYNQKYAQRWDFSALHKFFSEVMDEEDTEIFCTGLLPKIIQLALQLPALVTGPVPLLKRHVNAALSLSQLQVGSLLANAFLCTFPRRNSTNPQSEYAMYPEINFNRLFGAFGEERSDNRCEAVMEKFKCLFHYFRRITSKVPDGVITIQRRYISKENCPRWNRQDAKLNPLHITSEGTIETEGAGLLQVDFANKFVGGGVLGWGCVQEEIRFVICPELMASMLVAEALDDTEALLVSGVERYSNYEGYSDTFKWTGDFVDQTPRDSSGRRRTSVVAIDALLFKQSRAQFTTTNIIRELNKAYVGFSSSEVPKNSLPAIATGNWGCGAFRGDPHLKVLLQLMAATVAGRSMVYFTFGDVELRDRVAAMYWHLIEQNINVGRLFTLLCERQTYTSNSQHSDSDFYRFLYKRSRIKPLTNYFVNSTARSSEVNNSGDDKSLSNNNLNGLTRYTSAAKMKEDMEERNIENWLNDEEFEKEFENDFIPDDNRNAEKIRKSEDENDEKKTDDSINKKVRKFEHIEDTDEIVNEIESQDEVTILETKSKNPIDLKSLFFSENGNSRKTTSGVKKPRLMQGLDSLGRRPDSEVPEDKTLGVSTLKEKNKNDQGVKETKKRQKKISDFFT